MLIQKIFTENETIKKEIDKINERLDKAPENLEELHELREYCNKQLVKEVN